MTTTYVDWGGHTVKLTWMPSLLPERSLITSVHGFCFRNRELMMVNLNHRGWDFPGGHIEEGETVEDCFRREAMQEGYVEGDCTLLGSVEVNHSENPLWNESSPYPKIGYQVFFKMDIMELQHFEAGFESSERIFIKPEDVAHYYKGWHAVYDEILESAKGRCQDENQNTGNRGDTAV